MNALDGWLMLSYRARYKIDLICSPLLLLTPFKQEAFHNFDMGAFYSHWIRLIEDEQQNGTVTDVVPFTRYGSRYANQYIHSLL